MSVRILVVDDNRDTLKIYVRALGKKLKPKGEERHIKKKLMVESVEIEDVDTVSLALKKLRNKSFEILVVDLKIPGTSGEEMGGLELISESLKLDPLRPIIAITGYGEQPEALAKEARADTVIEKPFKLNKLIKTIQKLLDEK